MRKSNFFKSTFIIAIFAIFALVLAACSDSGSENEEADDQGNESAETEGSSEDATVEITDAHGTVEVPVNPENVVALDNRTFETLSDWGVELAAAPRDLIPEDIPYASDESIENIGNHREPNLELIAAADPDLVIVGQRFGGFYEDIKELVPDAAVIDLNFDVSEEADTPGENLENGFKDITISLGQIFDKNEEAEQLIADFEQSIEDAKSAYNGTDTIMSVIVSGGDINFAAPHSGRVWGPLYDIFDWTPALEIDQASADHQGDDVSVEAIAETDPDWLFVMDRDAAVSSEEEASPAQDVIDNAPALQNTKAVSEGQIVYAPADTYTNESIQTFTKLFEDLAETLAE
ncbi:iron ABC transporter substrate-binding protein [Oceanobacillus oncorhynchi subsp. incaldanensis]|uniref:Siderophore ABC transporter substrate-binding protein n=2 Tax=Oceanobacillus TaxID=182709 RepID=A0ABV9JWM8_9BACI|nr:siderophore ABC transporter substrate-binding protein [Oceanobacillus oncorhynchi]MDM8100201.1 siderophore ABC transporter substrate-binding protein [Oceanobacillus oncorhynchi]GIO19900.1 iron ABC transporter substrate-binding protein [Oceanobacillus oncorhynchi subsp. incaldanensis]CEI82426.1 putative ABC transporter solute-binding protein YclQ precursor [Oceanobacillus oncorhynchi]